jgi:alginate O-acetyltransferase complex protein AlgI
VIFTELRFFAFFALAFGVHWALRSNSARKTWLLACSYVFYGAWDWRFLGLIAGSTLLDYVAALRMRASPRPRAWLLVSLSGNLGSLALFKYYDFFLASALELSRALGFEASEHTLGLILPVGISFYTFQTLSYSIDVYRGHLEPVKRLDDFALFVAFFPQLVAGPIVRAVDFLPQLAAARVWRDVRVRACLTLFLVGFVKKACVSDNVVQLVDPYFAAPEQYSALGAWCATLFYAVQIYCDFSGYSDMAIAVAGLLGYELRVNFDFPYFAASIKEFWRRWHISLSSWLRDYLYIPLGGSRGSRWYARRNLMLTMLLGGLWHGAGWNFVIWGGLHGLALVVHRIWEERKLRLPAVVGVALTFWWVCLAWIFFRASSLEHAWTTVRAFVAFESAGELSWGLTPFVTFAVLAAAHALGATRAVGEWLERRAWPSYAIFYGAAFALAFAFMNGAVQPFIYFQF